MPRQRREIPKGRFRLRAGKRAAKGVLYSIELEYTLDRKIFRKATGLEVTIEQWDKTLFNGRGGVNSNHPYAEKVNEFLLMQRQDMDLKMSEYNYHCGPLTKEVLADILIGRPYKLNFKQWEKYTIASSDFYLRKMAKLKGNDLGIKEDSTLHGQPTPNHIMFKLDSIDVPGRKDMRYEFLIEYDIYEPHVGIYYGCKCITARGADHQNVIDQAERDFKAIRDTLIRVLNNVFSELDFSYRLRVTNNAENGTFWPFWIRLNEEEDIEQVGVKALKLIRHIYETYLKKDNSTQLSLNGKAQDYDTIGWKDLRIRYEGYTDESYDLKDSEVKFGMILDGYKKLCKKVDALPYNYGCEGASKKLRKLPKEILGHFMQKMLKKGIVEPDDWYYGINKVYKFKGFSEIRISDEISKLFKENNINLESTYVFPIFLDALFKRIIYMCLKEDGDKTKFIEKNKKSRTSRMFWKEIAYVFLDRNGLFLNPDNLKSLFDKNSEKILGEYDFLENPWQLLIDFIYES